MNDVDADGRLRQDAGIDILGAFYTASLGLMRNAPSLIFAFLAAILAPTLAITSYFAVGVGIAEYNGLANGSEFRVGFLVLVVAIFISAGHVFILGLPSVLLLKKFNRLSLWPTMVLGFVSGCIPMAVWSWPYDYSEFKSGYSYWDGKAMVDAKINGVPTLIGWIDYSQGVGLMGAFGALAGLAFWLTYRSLSPNPAVKRDAPQAARPLP